MLSMRSIVPCAMPSSRIASYSTGRTSRSVPTPMFFMARTVAPMLIGFCGSYNTTTTDASSDSVIGDSQWNQSLGIVAVASEIHEVAVGTAQHELSTPAFATARHLVHDPIESEGWRHRWQLDRHAVPCRGRVPLRTNRLLGEPAVDPTHTHGLGVALRDEHPSAQSVLGPK